VIDADGHVEPAAVVDWKRAIGGTAGERVERIAREWFDRTGHGSSTQPGAWDPAARLADMDKDSIHTAVLFGSSRGVHAFTGGDVALGPIVARAFNDWLASYCARDPSRLKAAAWVALEDIETACKEAERAVSDLGAVGVVIPPFAGDMAMDDPHYFPLYKRVEELGVPLLVHGAGELGSLAARYHTHVRRHAVAFPLSLMMASQELICGGILERFSRLRVALLEGGVGWVPWWIDRLDEHYELQPSAAPFIRAKPSELVARYLQEDRLFWSCELDESELPRAVETLGDGAIGFASDYPHWDCTFPGAVDTLASRDDLSSTAKERMFADNALRLYGSRLGDGC